MIDNYDKRQIENHIYHHETVYHGEPIIIDAAYIGENTIEIMCMNARATNIEYACKRTNDPSEAIKIFQSMRYDYSEQPHATLTGKYKQLKLDLIKVLAAGEAADDPEDGGTCNFDAPSIRGDRWIESKVIQAAREAGTTARKWKLYGNTRWVFGVPGGGQANRRTRKAEAMTEAFRQLGYDALTYSAMD